MISREALALYNQNKNIKWIPDPIPSSLTTNAEKASWILNDSDFGWIELNIPLDLETWKDESVHATEYFVEHRNNQGWNSCCIHGIDVDKTGAWTNYGYTDESLVPYNWTELSKQTPTIQDFWTDSFPTERYRRIRFMELKPNSAINPHSDMPGRLPGENNFDAVKFGVPVNIAIIHPSDCFMVLDSKGIIPFEEGKAFIVNIRHTHSVLNFSNQSRIHMIGHSFGYGQKINDFSKLVVESYIKQYEHR